MTAVARHKPPRLPGQRPGAPWGWATAGLLAGVLAALVLFAPARWLTGAIERASTGQVLLADARGTVWDGTARLVLTGGAGSTDATALPGRLQWQLRPAFRFALPHIVAAIADRSSGFGRRRGRSD